MRSGRGIVVDIQGCVTPDVGRSFLRSANHAKNRRRRHFYCPDEGLLVVNPDLPVASRVPCACVCAPTKEIMEYTADSPTHFGSTVLPYPKGMSSCSTQEGVSGESGGPCARCGGHNVSPSKQRRRASAPADEGIHSTSHPSPPWAGVPAERGSVSEGPSSRWKRFAKIAFGGGRKVGTSEYSSGGLLFTGRKQGSTSIVPSSGESRGAHFGQSQKPVTRSSALTTLFSGRWHLTTTGDRGQSSRRG